MIKNKLKMNHSKTEYIIIRSPLLKTDLSGMSISVGIARYHLHPKFVISVLYLEKKNKNTFISEKKCNIIIIFIKYVTYNSFLETAIMGSAA